MIQVSEAPARREHNFPALVDRLCEISVVKRHDAYQDIDWDAPDARIDRLDPRFCLSPRSALGATSWYQSLPPGARAELGLEWICQSLRYGVAFESCLSRGLLEYVGTLANGSHAYRYAMHELIEESHHSLMFQEFINRSGCDPRNVSRLDGWFHRRIARFGATFPELFFFCVLSGEIFGDHDNREQLRRREALHPLVRRIMEIHVTEEARHVSFAKGFLRQSLPRLSRIRKACIRAVLPILLDQGERMMLRPSAALVRRYSIPAKVLRSAFGAESAHRLTVRAIVAPIYALL